MTYLGNRETYDTSPRLYAGTFLEEELERLRRDQVPKPVELPIHIDRPSGDMPSNHRHSEPPSAPDGSIRDGHDNITIRVHPLEDLI